MHPKIPLAFLAAQRETKIFIYKDGFHPSFLLHSLSTEVHIYEEQKKWLKESVQQAGLLVWSLFWCFSTCHIIPAT